MMKMAETTTCIFLRGFVVPGFHIVIKCICCRTLMADDDPPINSEGCPYREPPQHAVSGTKSRSSDWKQLDIGT